MRNAEAALLSARTAREQLLGGGTMAEQVAAQSAVEDAANALRAAQERFRVLVGGGTVGEQGTLRAAVDSSYALQRSAHATYDRVRQGLTPAESPRPSSRCNPRRRWLATAQNNVATACTSTGLAALGCPFAQTQAIVAQGGLTAAQRRQTAVDAGAESRQPRSCLGESGGDRGG